MKLYTKTGDDGTTGLFGGGRAPKDHARVEAYGAVDELNAAIGLAASACASTSSALSELHEILLGLQSRLFDLGADLATPFGSKHEDKIVRVSPADVEHLEQTIDSVDGANAPMTSFVLPGGSEPASRLHLARTICRRAERRVLTLSRQEKINPHAIVLLNRASDLLFAMARNANDVMGVPDVPWTARVPSRRTHLR